MHQITYSRQLVKCYRITNVLLSNIVFVSRQINEWKYIKRQEIGNNK